MAKRLKEKVRFQERHWLNEKPKDRTSTVSGVVTEGEDYVCGYVEIRDCHRGIYLEFDISDAPYDGMTYAQVLQNNRKKARLLKDFFRRFEASLNHSAVAAGKRAAKLRAQKKKEKKGGKVGGGDKPPRGIPDSAVRG